MATPIMRLTVAEAAAFVDEIAFVEDEREYERRGHRLGAFKREHRRAAGL